MANALLTALFGRGLFSNSNKLSSLQPDEDGYYPISFIFGTSPKFNDYISEVTKLQAIFSSPALLKVFCLQCDLFSLGQIYVYKGDNEVDNDPAARLLNSPNPMQSRSQFLWDCMFYIMMGNAYCYVDSNVAANESNKLYFLDPSKMNWPTDFEKQKDKLILSKASEVEMLKTLITYKYEDGTSIQIPLSKIICITDLTNGTGNWFKGNSRIDALYKIISNSEATLDANNINTRYSGKFLVAGQQDPKNVTQLPLTGDEKLDIETKMNGHKQVHAVKSMIEIKRFVEDMRKLELGKAYLESYYLIGSMYNIPRDVLEAYNSSTFENQEKATAKHVSYTLQPKGDDFLYALAKRFGYEAAGKTICIDWSHLPFMQVFEKDRALTKKTQIETLTAMLKLGIDLKEVNEFLDTDFKNAKYEQPKPINQPTTAPAA